MTLIYLANLEEKSKRMSRDYIQTLHFPAGLGLISGALSTTDHTLYVLDSYIDKQEPEEILSTISNNRPDYILLTGFLGNYQYSFIKKITHKIRELSPNTIQIIGGTMASTIPGLLIKHSAVDYVVIGEGEETILDLINSIQHGHSVSNVNGIAYRGADGQTLFTAERPRMKDLTKFPLPKYSLFDMPSYIDYIKRTGRCWDILSSRGCFGKCKYCERTFGRNVTYRPLEHVLEEIRFIKQNYGIDRFNFVDDNFLNNTKRVEEFTDALRHFNETIQFRFQGRGNLINYRLAKKLKQVGCFGISFGLESGSQRIIDSMYKFINVKKAEENVKAVLDTGLEVHATFIIGMPMEDEQSIQETKDFIRRIGLLHANAGILTPFPNTEIYRIAKQQGLITDDDSYCENLGTVYYEVYVNFTKYTDHQLLLWRNEINSLSYN